MRWKSAKGSGREKLGPSTEPSRQLAILDALTCNTETCLVYLDRDFNFVWLNEAYAGKCAKTTDELIGRNHFKVYPHDENEAIFHRVRETGEPFRTREKPFVFPDHPDWGVTYWDWTLSPVWQPSGEIDGFALSLVDVTERVESNKELARAKHQAEERASEAEECRRILEVLMENVPLGIAIADAPDAVFRLVSSSGSRGLGYQRFEVEGQRDLDLVSAWQIHCSDGVTPLAPQDTPIGRAIRTGEATQNEELVVRTPGSDPMHVLCSATPMKSEDGSVTSAIFIWQDITGLRDEHRLLSEAYEHEHHIADTLQRAIMPRVSLDLPNFRIAAVYEPALSEAEVGGDFYDVFDVGNGQVGLVMGDVSGKGLEAAVHTAMAKYMLRAYAHEDSSPATVLERLNRSVWHYSQDDLFITIFYCVLNTNHGTISYANAGHEQPLVYSHDLGFETALDVTGCSIGIKADSRYAELSLRLGSGDAMLLYTDGVSDARSAGDLFGGEGVSRVFAAHVDKPENEIICAVYQSALDFAKGRLKDDAALLVVKAR